MPLRARADATPKIRIGYWPIAAGLPFYVALEKGYFKEAGLDVEGVKFAGPPQIVEAMIAGRLDGSANGTATAALAIGELASVITDLGWLDEALGFRVGGILGMSAFEDYVMTLDYPRASLR